jgi:hypothetical protein
MLAVQDLDLGGISVCPTHFAISTLTVSNVKTIGAEGFVYAGEVLSRGSEFAPDLKKVHSDVQVRLRDGAPAQLRADQRRSIEEEI